MILLTGTTRCSDAVDFTTGTSLKVVEFPIVLSATGTTSTVVTGQTWLKSTSHILCQPLAVNTDGQTVGTYLAAQLIVSVSDIVADRSFQVHVTNPNGATGVFRIQCIGVP